MSVHIQFQASKYTLSLCRGHSWRGRLAKQETLTPPGHLVSNLVCRGPGISTVVLYCWCQSDSASVLLHFFISFYWIWGISVDYDTFDCWRIYNKLHVYLIFSLVFVIFNSTDNYFKDICWLWHGGNSVTTKGRKSPSELY